MGVLHNVEIFFLILIWMVPAVVEQDMAGIIEHLTDFGFSCIFNHTVHIDAAIFIICDSFFNMLTGSSLYQE